MNAPENTEGYEPDAWLSGFRAWAEARTANDSIVASKQSPRAAHVQSWQRTNFRQAPRGRIRIDSKAASG